MTYNCRHCDFTWNTGEGDFQKVLMHEKTHRRPEKTSMQSIHNENFGNKLCNTKCPYCGADEVYFYELKFDNAGFCPKCNVNWIEVGNGTIWKIPE